MTPFRAGLIAMALIVIGAYFGFAKQLPFGHPFKLEAVFRSGVNVRKGTPVRIAGVNVGQVTSVSHYRGTQLALVKMEIDKGGLPIKRDATLLVVTERGMGKCSPIDEYRVQKRGGKGIITVNRTDKTGDAVALMEVLPEDELMLITKHGVAIRMPVKGIRVAGRNTQGVRLVDLDGGDLVMDVARVVPEDESEGEGSEEPAGVSGGDEE